MSEPRKRVFYRIQPQWRKHYAPWDGELYEELEGPDATGYAFVQVGNRRQAIPVSRFERVEAPGAAPAE